MSGRDNFTNPAVFKAEMEVRHAQSMYESAASEYHFICVSAAELLKVNNKDVFPVQVYEKISDFAHNLEDLHNKFIAKLESYKQLIGLT